MSDSSRAKLQLNRKRYRIWLERADDAHCLTSLWAVNALQSGNEEAAKRFISYPKGAAIERMTDKFAIHKWEIETVVTSLLTTPKDKPRIGRYKYTDLTNFYSISALINWLRGLEDGEFALREKSENIWHEMYRIGQRQFSWQRGYNTEQLYRYAFVYGQGDCAAFFAEEYGITISDFMLLSMGLFALTTEKPWIPAPNISTLKVPQESLAKALELHSIDLTDARVQATQMNAEAVRVLRAPLKIAYMPSVLRRKPIIRVTGRKPTYISPLPPLILNRATAGLYYDIKRGPPRLGTEANLRFEEYIRRLVKGYCARFDVFKGAPYGPNKATTIDPPDCLIRDGAQITIAIECKATKLTFEGQFAENPMIAAKHGLEQLAKGIFQLWRFFSHARRGLYAAHQVAPGTYGIVLTMDAWMQMARRLREGAVERARELAAADPQIIEEDMRKVVFASVQELNDTLAQTEPGEFMEVLRHAVSEKFDGYQLPSVARESGVPLVRKRFPLDVAGLLPWWKDISDPDQKPYL